MATGARSPDKNFLWSALSFAVHTMSCLRLVKVEVTFAACAQAVCQARLIHAGHARLFASRAWSVQVLWSPRPLRRCKKHLGIFRLLVPAFLLKAAELVAKGGKPTPGELGTLLLEHSKCAVPCGCVVCWRRMRSPLLDEDVCPYEILPEEDDPSTWGKLMLVQSREPFKVASEASALEAARVFAFTDITAVLPNSAAVGRATQFNLHQQNLRARSTLKMNLVTLQMPTELVKKLLELMLALLHMHIACPLQATQRRMLNRTQQAL